MAAFLFFVRKGLLWLFAFSLYQGTVERGLWAAPGGFTEFAAQSGLLYDQWDVESREGVPGILIHTGAAAAGDFDGDGWVDLFVTRLDATDILFRNLGGETEPGETIIFQNVSTSAGFDLVAKTNGAAWADVDNDGDLDLYLTAVESNRFYLYENNGDGTFTENALDRGAALESSVEHAGQGVTFGDFDRDGWLDFHTTEWGISRDGTSISQHSVLMRNLGPESPGHFENVTVAAGVEMDTGDTLYGFASSFTDLDNDGWPDLAVTSDYKTAKLFWNNGDGTFHDGTTAAKVNLATNSMGSAIGDFDGNGYLDWYVTSIHDNRLYLNQGDRTFVDRAAALGVADGSWGWGTSFIDIENDGDKDIVMTNGWYYSTFGPEGNNIYTVDNMKLWRNDEGEMSDQGVALGVTDTREGKGLLTFDFDRDGDLDIFVANNASRPVLYRNDISSGNDWLQVELRGTRSNSRGIGAKVWLYPANGDEPMLEEIGGKSHFLGQSEAIAHFGLGVSSGDSVRLEIQWPSGIRQIVEGVSLNQRLVLTEPEQSDNFAPSISTQLVGSVVVKDASFALEIESDGFPVPVYQWYRNGERLEGVAGARLEFERIKPHDSGTYHVVVSNTEGSVQSAPVEIEVDWDISQYSIARVWNEVLLDAIRKDFPAPTVHGRNLYHVTAAMWDAYWAFDERGWSEAEAAFAKETIETWSGGASRDEAKREAISYAAYRVLKARYERSIGREKTLIEFDWAMALLGYDISVDGTEGDRPAEIGNRIAARVLAATLDDGSNEANDYADDTGYFPVNEPLAIDLPGGDLIDPNRWQPLAFDVRISQNGIPLTDNIQTFVGPNWSGVTSFSGRLNLVRGGEWDPGAPPFLGTETQGAFLEAVNEVIRFSSLLDPSKSEMIDISPGARHRNALGMYGGIGYDQNPVTGRPYDENWVSNADYGRILAEFWADGPQSETPPGHWNALYNEISEDPLFVRKLGGTGPLVDPLEWDLMVYLAMNGGMHDAAIAAWWLKREYDYVRPISMIRYLSGLGQSSNPDLPSYDELGMLLEPGLVELISAASSASGERHEHLGEFVGEIAIYCWQGEPADPETEAGGVGWILAQEWLPYQRDTFVTPAFAGYVSGHSTFSRSGAEVLTLMTGNPYFPGGLGSFTFKKSEYLEFEDGPSEDLTLQWATYYDAADEAGLSRLYGGIHVRADDLVGRVLGARVGLDAFVRMKELRFGAVSSHALGGLRVSARSANATKATLFGLDYEKEGAPLQIRWGDVLESEEAVYLIKDSQDWKMAVEGREVTGIRVPIETEGNGQVARFEFALEGDYPRLLLSALYRADSSDLGDAAGYELWRRDVGSSGDYEKVEFEYESESLLQVGRMRVSPDFVDLPTSREGSVSLLGAGEYQLRVNSMATLPAAYLFELSVLE